MACDIGPPRVQSGQPDGRVLKGPTHSAHHTRHSFGAMAPTKRCVMATGRLVQSGDSKWLYDLSVDIGEANNLKHFSQGSSNSKKPCHRLGQARCPRQPGRASHSVARSRSMAGTTRRTSNSEDRTPATNTRRGNPCDPPSFPREVAARPRNHALRDMPQPSSHIR